MTDNGLKIEETVRVCCGGRRRTQYTVVTSDGTRLSRPVNNKTQAERLLAKEQVKRDTADA